MITDALDFIADIVGDVTGTLADTIVGDLVHGISVFLGSRLLRLAQLILELVRAAYALFSVFAGITKVQWDGEYTYLFDVFFRNSTINGVYWGMAMIGFVLLIAFTIVAVIRKMFDLGDQERRSLGQILGSTFKGFLVIISMTGILSAGTSLSNLLIQQVSIVFDQGASLSQTNEWEFTDEQYATMARIFNTIGNYSLNPGYTQHYNLNACYNEIRPDLLYLQNQGIFDFVYSDVDANGNPDPTWQSELQKLIYANDPNHPLKMDPYYEGVSNALTEIMDILQTDAEFYPVSSVKNSYYSATEVSLDRVLFISGTMNAAKNEVYNQEPAFDDGVRGAFYTGEKSIYSLLDVTEVFDIALGSINYVVILLGAYWVLKNLFRCLLNCTARIVNIIGLYVVAPPIAASIPLDGGQRFREWVKSMVIQLIGIFGNIIPMRLVMLFMPIIMSSKLTLVTGSAIINIFAKIFLVWGMLEAVGRFNGVLTGVLAGNGAGGAMRGIESMNKTADTRFSRYGGKYLRGTTDVDDPTGRGAKAEKQHKQEMAEQRNLQQQQQSGGGQSGGQLRNAAIKAGMAAATGGASAAMGASGGASAAMGATGGSGGGMGSFSGGQGGSGGMSGFGGGQGGSGSMGGLGGGQDSGQSDMSGFGEDPSGNISGNEPQDSEPESLPREQAEASQPIADNGQSDHAEARQSGESSAGPSGSGGWQGAGSAGSDQNARYAEAFAKGQPGPAKQSQLDALFGNGEVPAKSAAKQNGEDPSASESGQGVGQAPQQAAGKDQAKDFTEWSGEDRQKTYNSLFGAGHVDPISGKAVNIPGRTPVPKRKAPPPRKKDTDKK